MFSEIKKEYPKQEHVEAEAQEKEIVVESREKATGLVKETFRRILEERFGSKGKEPMDFHSPEHSETVAKDARAFLEIIRRFDPGLVPEEYLDEAEIEGWAHDLVQNSTKDEGNPRQRHRGFKVEDIPPDLREKKVSVGNEGASADELRDELSRYRLPNGERVFSNQEIENMANDIAVTFPKFDFNAKLPDGSSGLKIWQPYVNADTSLIGLALSIGDLQGDARISKDLTVFRERGNAEFRELNFEIGEAVVGGIENIPQDKKVEYAKAIIEWAKVQIGFIAWQKELFWKKVNTNKILKGSGKSKEIKEEFKNEFSHFDANINSARERYEKLEARYGGKLDAISDQDFRDLLLEIGYKV